jgi:hypothetical protein
VAQLIEFTTHWTQTKDAKIEAAFKVIAGIRLATASGSALPQLLLASTRYRERFRIALLVQIQWRCGNVFFSLGITIHGRTHQSIANRK